MFGIIRPCRHRLDSELRNAWRAHLCGMCLSLRDDHGQLARLATNYDGLIISVLAEAQAPAGAPADRRLAGPCPLRGMRRAEVATGDCARLAATVSLVLAAAKVRDHEADGDGIAGQPGLRKAARILASSWESQGAAVGTRLGFDTRVLTEAVTRQEALEAAAGPGTSLLAITEPTETATGAAFAATAVLAGRPGNEAPLTEAGRLFGRIAHLLDAVEDLPEDTASGAWNPLTATGATAAEARRLCEDALAGIGLALADAEFSDRRLVDKLLAGELTRSVRRAFGAGHAGSCSARAHRGTAQATRDGTRLAGLAAISALAVGTGLCAGDFPGERRRRRRPCGEGCCCGDCCCDCGCECCGEGCCEGCCEGADCCDCNC